MKRATLAAVAAALVLPLLSPSAKALPLAPDTAHHVELTGSSMTLVGGQRGRFQRRSHQGRPSRSRARQTSPRGRGLRSTPNGGQKMIPGAGLPAVGVWVHECTGALNELFPSDKCP